MAMDLLFWDNVGETFKIKLKYSSLGVVLNKLYLAVESTQVAQPAVTDTYGRNAVWSEAQLAGLVDASGMVDHSGNHTLSVSGSPTVTDGGPLGRYVITGNNIGYYTSDSALLDLPETYDMTVDILAYSDHLSDNSPYEAAVAWDGLDDLLIYPIEDYNVTNGDPRVFWRDVTSGLAGTTGTVSIDTWEQVSFTTRASNDHELCVNGSSIDTDSGTGTAGPFTTFRIGYWGTQYWTGRLAEVVIWKTARSNAWVASYNTNRDNPGAFWVGQGGVAAGGGDISLVAGQGSATSQGISPSLTVTQSYSAVAGQGSSVAVGLVGSLDVGVSYSTVAGVAAATAQGVTPTISVTVSFSDVAGVANADAVGVGPSLSIDSGFTGTAGIGEATSYGVGPTLAANDNFAGVAGVAGAASDGYQPTLDLTGGFSEVAGIAGSGAAGHMPTISTTVSFVGVGGLAIANALGLQPSFTLGTPISPNKRRTYSVGAMSRTYVAQSPSRTHVA